MYYGENKQPLNTAQPVGQPQYGQNYDQKGYDNKGQLQGQLVNPIRQVENQSGIVPEKKYNDVFFAVLFVAHVGLIGYYGFTKGVDEISGKNRVDSTADHKYETPDVDVNIGSEGIYGMMTLCAVGIGVAYGLIKLCVTMGEDLIHFAIRGTICLYVVLAVFFFAAGVSFGGMIFLIMAAIIMCWYRCVQSRIAFAGANLSVACAVVKQYPNVVLASVGATFINFAWLVLWGLAMIGVAAPSGPSPVIQTESGSFDSQLCTSLEYDGATCMSAEGCCYCAGDGATATNEGGGCDTGYGMTGGTYFLLLISLYWGSTVISNLMHCVTAGTVATWWFKSQADMGSSPVWDSFVRATTTSFGSICFGSLLVAIIKAIRAMLREAKKNKNAQLLICLIDCMLSCIERLLEIFNRYAFCYVAIYGYDFRRAGQATFDLFKNLGWTTIINDDLIETVFSFLSLAAGGVCGLVGFLYATAVDMSSTWVVILVITGVVFGYSMAWVTLNVCSSAVATIFVCFAEAPEALAATHPMESQTLGNAWKQHHGDTFNACGYTSRGY